MSARLAILIAFAAPAIAQNAPSSVAVGSIGDINPALTVHWCVRAVNDSAPQVWETVCDVWSTPTKVREFALKQAARFMTPAEVTREITGKSITKISDGGHYKDWILKRGTNSYVLIFTYDDSQSLAR